MGSSVDQTGGLGRRSESYSGYLRKLELTGFANGFDIRNGKKEELMYLPALVGCPE